MAKVRDAAASIRVQVNRLSIFINALFMAKIIVAPLFAYFTEPFPWASPPPVRDTWGDFDHYNNWTFAYLEHIYIAETWSNDLLMAFNVTTSTYATRTTMTLSPNANLADTINHFVGFRAPYRTARGFARLSQSLFSMLTRARLDFNANELLLWCTVE
ncbi:unnamed protein product [Aphanomyces euteiches]